MGTELSGRGPEGGAGNGCQPVTHRAGRFLGVEPFWQREHGSGSAADDDGAGRGEDEARAAIAVRGQGEGVDGLARREDDLTPGERGGVGPADGAGQQAVRGPAHGLPARVAVSSCATPPPRGWRPTVANPASRTMARRRPGGGR